MPPLENKTEERIRDWKDRLGIFRIPLGVFFMLVTLFLVITPFTPGSLVTFIIALDLLGLRETVQERIKRWRK